MCTKWFLGTDETFSFFIFADLKFISQFPTEEEILAFDVESFWRKLEEKEKSAPKMSSSSPPLSPVLISKTHLWQVPERSGKKTSTPLQCTLNVADRKATFARRSLDMENVFQDDDFPEAATMSMSFDCKVASQNAGNGDQERSRQTNSQFKDDSSFLKAVMASSFGRGENAEAEKAPAVGKENSTFFDASCFVEKTATEDGLTNSGANSSLYSATQVLSFAVVNRIVSSDKSFKKHELKDPIKTFKVLGSSRLKILFLFFHKNI